jgi:hypothetical protein
MELLGDMGHVKPCFGLLETVLVLVQDRFTVCDVDTTGSKIILHANVGTVW